MWFWHLLLSVTGWAVGLFLLWMALCLVYFAIVEPAGRWIGATARRLTRR